MKDAENPIDAAIGSKGEDNAAEAFNNEMTKDDQIAAAMVLRGMAQGGQFALKSGEYADHAKAKG
ncbi:variable large family protein, partial [Borreliella garinii]|uniref:variable large family protein n=1 Tax=Borreliella garinii TaxID=29519 RepID=UPI002E1947F4